MTSYFKLSCTACWILHQTNLKGNVCTRSDVRNKMYSYNILPCSSAAPALSVVKCSCVYDGDHFFCFFFLSFFFLNLSRVSRINLRYRKIVIATKCTVLFEIRGHGLIHYPRTTYILLAYSYANLAGVCRLSSTTASFSSSLFAIMRPNS